jgi:hypothetical protein
MYSLILNCEHLLKAVCSNRNHVIQLVLCWKMVGMCIVDVEFKRFCFCSKLISSSVCILILVVKICLIFT